MRIGSVEFSTRELAGSMGDCGTLLPLAIGYITVCKMNPREIWPVLRDAGLAQVPLTATNAVIARWAPLNIHFLLRPAVQAAYCVALGLPKMRCASSRGRYHCGYALLARLVCGLLARPRDKTE